MRIVIWAAWCAMFGIAVVSPSRAQGYPDKPLRFVVPFPPGGGADNLARIVGQRVSENLRQHLVVDNRAGAGGNVAAEVAAHATPDGYTLLQANVAHTIARSLYRKLQYDLLADFDAVTQLASIPFVLLVNPALGAGSVKALIGIAKQRPGQLTYASSGSGGPSHMAMELFKSMTGVNMRHIPYRGATPAAADLIAGRVNMMFFTVSAALPQVKSGKLQALAIASAARSPLFPDLMTMKEAGIAGFEASTWFGVMVPAKTPAKVIDRLHQAFTAALRAPAVRQRLEAQGFEIIGSTPAEFKAYVRSEIPKWAAVVKTAGIVAE